jgi:hypothetical protein
MPTGEQSEPSAGRVIGQSLGSQQTQASLLQSQVVSPYSQSPRPSIQLAPFIG